MSNKIIKVSIVLIFILFSAGLFNFCFAWEFKSLKEYSINLHNGNYNLSIGQVSDLPDITIDNISGGNYESSEYYNKYINNGYFIETKNNLTLRLYISIDKSSAIISYPNSYSIGFTNHVPFDPNIYSPNGWCNYHRFIYNTVTENWEYDNTVAGSLSLSGSNVILDSNLPLYGYVSSSNYNLGYSLVYDFNRPSIDMKVVQTGTRTGHVEFTKVNWDSPHMYYIKGSKEDLQELKNKGNLSITHSQVKYYDGPVSIEYGEYVLGLLFDNGEIVFSEISDSVTINYDILTDNSHKLYIDKENENSYYLSIHGYQDGDYLKISDVPIENDAFSNHYKLLDNLSASLEYNGLSIGQAYETSLGHKNRKITLSKNGVTYFYLYDVNNNLINCVVINSSNYYSGEEFNFDVELQYGSSNSNSNEIRWVKIIPRINVSSIDNYELYLKISDYGNIPYIQEEDRCIFATHDINGNDYLGVDIGTNSNTAWYRIDNKISDYFYINTFTHDSTFTFELQLRSGLGQVIETKSFKVNLSASNKDQGTISSSTNGKNDTYVRDPEELSGIVSNSNKFDFSGLNDLSETDLKTNVNGLIDNSIGFFGLVSTFLLLLPTWISSLLYLFFFGIIVITLLRFIRGS